ncbi:hypothetical protein GCM10010123_42240 [Pilimelia anulata]|uniref:Copper transporter n=1 Tax=Pilimelia anulata TaxID=53371 RepID=A0A8J3BBV6_9ACTN|nr:copper transporter [Pilimelia anulata]GGK07832.1 hypothetical protein GCM10010123_42240 [Pilimelia anulata]
MINFRYHVVSLTAVFLALAIGLVVGTAALNGPVADSLNDQINTLGRTNGDLREQVGHLTAEASGKEDFLRQAAPRIVGGTLTNRRVLLLATPGGGEHVDGVRQMLVAAGAKIAGRVELTEKFTDPANSVELLDLADRALVPSIPAASLPGNSDGVEKSSALLGGVLLERTPAVPATDQRSVLSAYQAAGYLSVNSPVTGPAEVVVMVAGLPYTDKDAAPKNKNLLTLATQLDRAGRIVLGAPGIAGDGNVVGAVRGDPTLARTISTVDNAGTAQGQLVTALAVAGQLGNVAGQYGIGAGAQGLLPRTAA